MIVRDEERTLEKCLSSVADLVDQIVIVDTGSIDKTKEIAQKFTQDIFDFKWIDDFSEARNFSFSKANMDYIMWLDADDVILPEDREKLLKLKKSFDPLADAFSMNYNCDFDKYGNPTVSVRRIRIVKRSKKFKWKGAVHEDLISALSVKLIDTDIVITHCQIHKQTNRNLKIYENRLLAGKKFSSQDCFHYARELHHNKMYEKAVKFYLKFLKNNKSSEENKIFVCFRLADCFYHLGNTEKEMKYTFKSFIYDIPRPEACCRLGYHLLQNKKLNQAVYWYNQAIACRVSSEWAIVNGASNTWLPHMQLGQCYFELGMYKLSYEHNKKVLTYLPDDENVKKNMRMLEGLLDIQDKS